MQPEERVRRQLGTPHGTLLNELRMSPEAVSREVSQCGRAWRARGGIHELRNAQMAHSAKAVSFLLCLLHSAS